MTLKIMVDATGPLPVVEDKRGRVGQGAHWNLCRLSADGQRHRRAERSGGGRKIFQHGLNLGTVSRKLLNGLAARLCRNTGNSGTRLKLPDGPALQRPEPESVIFPERPARCAAKLVFNQKRGFSVLGGLVKIAQ